MLSLIFSSFGVCMCMCALRECCLLNGLAEPLDVQRMSQLPRLDSGGLMLRGRQHNSFIG